ncbi:hypothetical protein ACIQ7S_14860 [Streptomyces griseoluteus]|uniref:hypothetical protein n=1 Tax=Streptomyces griseoluteus TaxID=29306 RepID=UPI0033329336
MNLSPRQLGTGPAAAAQPTPTLTPPPVRRLPAEPVTVPEDQATAAAHTGRRQLGRQPPRAR